MLEPTGNDTKSRIPDSDPADDASGTGTAAIGTDSRQESAGSGPTRPALRPDRPRQWGSRPGRLGVFTIIAAALVGAAVTALSGRDPGLTLGVFVIVGTVIAATIVRLRSVYMIFPVPALAYVTAAVIAGLIHDRATDTSNTGLTLNGVQWIAAGFVAMTAATILAIAIAAGRWLWRRWVWSRT
ncbi:MAG: DUF6542 domain-containing protein [Streptosporangiaceae bacterium]